MQCQWPAEVSPYQNVTMAPEQAGRCAIDCIIRPPRLLCPKTRDAMLTWSGPVYLRVAELAADRGGNFTPRQPASGGDMR